MASPSGCWVEQRFVGLGSCHHYKALPRPPLSNPDFYSCFHFLHLLHITHFDCHCLHISCLPTFAFTHQQPFVYDTLVHTFHSLLPKMRGLGCFLASCTSVSVIPTNLLVTRCGLLCHKAHVALQPERCEAEACQD